MPSMRSTTVSGPASAKADSRPASAAIGRYRARYASRVVNAASSVLDPRSHPGQSNADAATFLRFGPSSIITRTGSDILDTLACSLCSATLPVTAGADNGYGAGGAHVSTERTTLTLDR